MSSACRIGFDQNAMPDDAGAAARADTGVATAPHPCGAKTTAPDPLELSGDVFMYTDFKNSRSSLDGATIAALADDGSILSTARSSGGSYAMTIATGGHAPSVRIRATLDNYYTTTTYLDTLVDRPVDVQTSSQWSFGEAPLWNAGSMISVYSVAGQAVDPSKGIYNIVVEDCLGQPLGGVAIEVTPAPAAQINLTSDGTADYNGLTLTPYSSAVGFNQPPGPAHITASAPGYTFAPVDVIMDSGVGTTMVLMQPII